MAERDCRGVTARIDRTNHVPGPINVTKLAHAIPDEILFALEMGSLGIICQNHPDGTNGLLAELLAPCDFCQISGTIGFNARTSRTVRSNVGKER